MKTEGKKGEYDNVSDMQEFTQNNRKDRMYNWNQFFKLSAKNLPQPSFHYTQ